MKAQLDNLISYPLTPEEIMLFLKEDILLIYNPYL